MPPMDAAQMEQFKAWQAMQSNQQQMAGMNGQQIASNPTMTQSFPILPASQANPMMNNGMAGNGMMPNNGMMMQNNGMMPNSGMMIPNNGMMMMPGNGMMMMPNNGMMMPNNGMMMMPNGMMMNPMMMNMYMSANGQFPVAQPQVAEPSKVPPAMYDILNWIITVATDWEGKIFVNKKLKSEEILPSIFELREKWNKYFAEYKKNKDLGSDKEFRGLLDQAGEKTTVVIEMLRLRKKKTRPFLNSTRLTDLCQDIDKMVAYSEEKKQVIKNRLIIKFSDDVVVDGHEAERVVLKSK